MLGGRQGQVNEGHACGSLAVDGNSGHCLNMRLRYLPNPPGSRQRKRSALLNAQKANAVGQILGHIHVHNPLGNLYENYEDRLTLLELGFQSLRLWVLEPHDLILSKLAKNNPKVRDDVKFLVTKLSLSFEVLYRRWESEMKPWIANADRHETTINLWKSYFQQ
jgi:hypothetical protein